MDRVKLGDKFRDPKGKSPVKYGNIMEKLNITREQAKKKQKNMDLQFRKKIEIKVQRGRPKKDNVAVDTSGSEMNRLRNHVAAKKKESSKYKC